MSGQSAPSSKPTIDKVKVRKLMRFWVFGTFIITFAAVTTYAGMWTGVLIFRQLLYWVIIGITAVACGVILLIHEWYLKTR